MSSVDSVTEEVYVELRTRIISATVCTKHYNHSLYMHCTIVVNGKWDLDRWSFVSKGFPQCYCIPDTKPEAIKIIKRCIKSMSLNKLEDTEFIIFIFRKVPCNMSRISLELITCTCAEVT